MNLANEVFGFYTPTVNLMGVGSHLEIGKQVKILGGVKPLIVTDEGIVKAGILKKVIDVIHKDAAVECEIFDETVANPTNINVEKGLKKYKENKCDMIISLGGGSSHDCAKGIGIVATNGGKIQDYEGVDKSKKAMPPFIAVTTTAGTASEMTRFCIITDSERKIKMAIVDWRTTPNVAIVDPLLMICMPSSLTAATGMDALTHAVEAYVSTIATPVTDACALKAVELISSNLRQAYSNGQDMVARNNMAYAQYLAGMAFNNASLGYVHAMAHQLGGMYDLPHGVCNAILLPHVSEYNLISKLDRFVNIAISMGENVYGLSTRAAADKAIDAIKDLSEDVEIPEKLSELGVKEESITLMSENAMKDVCGFTNPRTPTLEDVIYIYKQAL